MSWFQFGLTYAVAWWLVLFMLLPIKAQLPVNPETGHAAGAPAKTYLRWKLLGATVIGLLFCLLLKYAFDHRWITL